MDPFYFQTDPDPTIDRIKGSARNPALGLIVIVIKLELYLGSGDKPCRDTDPKHCLTSVLPGKYIIKMELYHV